jgi:hypothetical protein
MNMKRQFSSISTKPLCALLLAAAVAVGLGTSSAAAAENPILASDGKPSRASWSVTSAQIGVKLCLTLSAKPKAGDSIDLVKVKRDDSSLTIADSTAEGNRAPWKKADWTTTEQHCWVPREGNTDYNLALIDAAGKATALSANHVHVDDNLVGAPAPGAPAPGAPAPGAPAPGALAPGALAPGALAPGAPAPGAPVLRPSVTDDAGKHDKVEVLEKAQAEATTKIQAYVDERSVWTGRRELTLYFLPNGRPVHPFPVDLSERDTIHLVVLMPLDELDATLNVTACPDRQPFRIDGSFEAAKKLAGEAQGAFPPVGGIGRVDLPDLRCGAGQIAFEVKTPYGSTSHSLKLGEVYTGTFGVQFTFNFTHNGSLALQLDSSGKSIITRNTDFLGPKVVPVFVLHPFGFDAAHASVGGALVNPTLGFDLDAITSSFYAGDSICLYFGCLTAGLQIRRVDELQGPSGLKVGDAYDPTKGALPTTQRFTGTDGGLGPYIGAILDVNAAAKLISGK